MPTMGSIQDLKVAARVLAGLNRHDPGRFMSFIPALAIKDFISLGL